MRYSLLVYIRNMGKTLLEAAQYRKANPQSGMQEELTENGRLMLGQIRLVLEQHAGDIKSGSLMETLGEIERCWESSAAEPEIPLDRFVQALPKEVSFQVRAVFFAELGGKWDSMASVYEYMRQDPRFDPVVVRTPIWRFVIREGKQEQEIIYKDFLTPMGIPSLGYNQYQIEEDCPDLAFISQPYESCTMERFWPENIAKYTRLVYLPYWAPHLITGGLEKTVCQMRVHQCAWKVCGISEKFYQYYCNYAANGGSNMIVTGIPKFDFTVGLKDKTVAIPQSWQSAVKDKKVFLWNTWYVYHATSIRYFRQIADWFRNHEDCLLIWRPHPMLDAVTKLNETPEVYQELQEYVSTIKELPNAIYDDEVSYAASFACSHALISDFSSMVFQYLPLDKPVLWITSPSGPCSDDTEFFIDWRWMEYAVQPDEILQFLDRIRQGDDRKKEMRTRVLQRDLPLADGHSGERVCEMAYKLMQEEDFG